MDDRTVLAICEMMQVAAKHICGYDGPMDVTILRPVDHNRLLENDQG